VAEEIAARYFPQRLATIDVADFPEANVVQKNISLVLRACFFGFLMAAFITQTSLLYVGTALFILPAFINLLSHKFPNVPKLYQILPGGLPGLTFGLVAATAAGAFVAKQMPNISDAGSLTFVGATGASAMISIIGMFGREPVEGDVRWYLRPKNVWIYRIGGIVVFALTLRATGIF
jgi:hypothetical protein